MGSTFTRKKSESVILLSVYIEHLERVIKRCLDQGLSYQDSHTMQYCKLFHDAATSYYSNSGDHVNPTIRDYFQYSIGYLEALKHKNINGQYDSDIDFQTRLINDIIDLYNVIRMFKG